MHVRIWGWLCLSLVLAACPPEPLGECGSYFCAAEERCEPKTLVCVNDLAPVIVVTPRSGVVSTPTFELTGSIRDDARVTAATWQLGTGAATPITLEPDGAFVVTVDAPLLDSQDVVVTLKAKDQRTEVSKDVTVKIDRVGPSFRVVRPLVGSLIGTATFELAVETTDGSGALSTLQINQVSRAAPQSGAEIGENIAVPPTANGTALEVELLATDAVGNQAREVVQFIGDRVAPEVAFVTPALNQYVITERFDAVVSVVEPSAIASAAFQLGGATVMGTEVSPGQWSAELTTAIVEQDQLISVDVTDAAGNTTTVQRTVKVDRIQPTLSVTSPAAASIHGVAIPLTVTTSQGTSQVGASLEGQQVTLTGGPTSWTGTLPVPQRDFSAAMVQVTALDLAGNSRVITVPISVDTVPPVVAFTTPSAGQKFNAAQLAANSNITTTWTVSDADPQAGTTTVNGSASTALTITLPSAATDNPRDYTTVVVARDRAGNTSTASRSYSVDRVVPTIVAWTPAANTRNIESSVLADITFSEPVSAALPTSPALIVTGRVASGDQWLTGHARYNFPLSFPGQVVEVSVAPGLADGHGNPLAPVSARKFHVATVIPAGVLATNVSTFAAASDADGAVTVTYIDASTRQIHVLQDRAGTLTPTTLNGSGTTVTVNASNVVNATTLVSTPSFAVSSFDSSVNVYKFFWSVGGSVTSAASSFAGAAIGQGPLNREPTTAATGYVVNSIYSRGSHSVTLPSPANMVVANSPDSWVVVDQSGSTMSWSRYRCNRDTRLFPGPDTFTCAGTEYRGALNTVVPTRIEAAMKRSGSCLVVSALGTGNQAIFYQRLDNCDGSLGVSPPASCNSNTNMPNGNGFINQRIAPYAANGEDTILFAFPANNNVAGDFRLDRMMPGVCEFSSTFTSLVNVPNVREYAPIQAGNRAGLLTVNTSNQLRIDYP